MKILVVEDQAKHTQDAKDFFSKIEGLKVTYAENCEMATIFMYPKYGSKPDGIITDIFIPLRYGDRFGDADSPCGIKIMAMAQKDKTPCVFCTSDYHHGAKLQWILELSQLMGWPMMVDNGNSEKEATTKDWSRAFDKLKEELAEKK